VNGPSEPEINKGAESRESLSKYLTEENYCYAQCLFILLTQLDHYNKEFQKNEMNYDKVLTIMKDVLLFS